MNINKAKALRKLLKLTPTQAGVLLFGYRPKQAYDTWIRWENGSRRISLSTEKYFDLIFLLFLARDLKTPGAEKSLDIFIGLLTK